MLCGTGVSGLKNAAKGLSNDLLLVLARKSAGLSLVAPIIFVGVALGLVAVMWSEPAEAEPAVDPNTTLEWSTDCVFEGAAVWDVLNFIEDVFSLSIRVDTKSVYAPEPSLALGGLHPYSEQPSYTTDGMFIALDLRDMRLFEVLDEICADLNLAYAFEPGFIWISSAELIAREVVPEPDERFEAYKSEADALKVVSLKFDEVHLHEVAKFLSRTYKLNVVWDHRVVDPGRAKPYVDLVSAQVGNAMNGSVPYIDLRNIQLRDCLKALLRPLNLAYQVQGESMVIASSQRFQQATIDDSDLVSPEVLGKRWTAYQAARTQFSGTLQSRATPDWVLQEVYLGSDDSMRAVLRKGTTAQTVSIGVEVDDFTVDFMEFNLDRPYILLRPKDGVFSCVLFVEE